MLKYKQCRGGHRVTYLTCLSKGTAEHNGIVRRQTMLKATKNVKLRRAEIDYTLKGQVKQETIDTDALRY